VLTFDADLRLTSINPAGEMLFEISAKKAVGQRLAELLPHARLAQDAAARPWKAGTRSPPAACAEAAGPPHHHRGLHGDAADRRRAGPRCWWSSTQVDRLLRLARDESMLDRRPPTAR
jgi:two-component system, NtrC family, nitrogen regulation sensor histidine kinase GlnL